VGSSESDRHPCAATNVRQERAFADANPNLAKLYRDNGASIWFFIAGTAWAGLPACFLAWCGSGRGLRPWEWSLRLACGFGAAYLAWRIFAAYPRVFLPLYDSLQAKYLDFHAWWLVWQCCCGVVSPEALERMHSPEPMG
jgi:hypothetical protein